MFFKFILEKRNDRTLYIVIVVVGVENYKMVHCMFLKRNFSKSGDHMQMSRIPGEVKRKN